MSGACVDSNAAKVMMLRPHRRDRMHAWPVLAASFQPLAQAQRRKTIFLEQEAVFERHSMRKLHVIQALLAIAIAAIAWLVIAHAPVTRQAEPAAVLKAVPVTAAEVRRADVPVYFRTPAWGRSRPFNSVLVVRSRVEGQIVKIDFAEGQEVHAGDVSGGD